MLVNPIKFKRIRFQRLARVKFVNLILPKPPFQLGFVGTGRIGVVAYHAINVEDASAAPERQQTMPPNPSPNLMLLFDSCLAFNSLSNYKALPKTFLK